jgi:hypothetical protein
MYVFSINSLKGEFAIIEIEIYLDDREIPKRR